MVAALARSFAKGGRYGCPLGNIDRNGFERRTDKDKIHFFNVAKASAGEVRSQLYVAVDVGYISETERVELNEEFKSLASQIAGFMKYLGES